MAPLRTLPEPQCAEQMKPKAKGLETLPFVTHLREFRAAKTISEPFVFCFKFLNRKHKKVLVYTHTHTP